MTRRSDRPATSSPHPAISPALLEEVGTDLQAGGFATPDALLSGLYAAPPLELADRTLAQLSPKILRPGDGAAYAAAVTRSLGELRDRIVQEDSEVRATLPATPLTRSAGTLQAVASIFRAREQGRTRRGSLVDEVLSLDEQQQRKQQRTRLQLLSLAGQATAHLLTQVAALDQQREAIRRVAAEAGELAAGEARRTLARLVAEEGDLPRTTLSRLVPLLADDDPLSAPALTLSLLADPSTDPGTQEAASLVQTVRALVEERISLGGSLLDLLSRVATSQGQGAEDAALRIATRLHTALDTGIPLAVPRPGITALFQVLPPHVPAFLAQDAVPLPVAQWETQRTHRLGLLRLTGDLDLTDFSHLHPLPPHSALPRLLPPPADRGREVVGSFLTASRSPLTSTQGSNGDGTPEHSNDVRDMVKEGTR